MTPISPDQYETLCFTCGACTGKPWVSLTSEELASIVVEHAGFPTRQLAAIEAALRSKNENT